jgi:hypothetical protein
MNRRPAQLRFDQVRTFGRIMADTRTLVRNNFVVFFKTMLFIVGPFVLLTCTLETFYQIEQAENIDSYGGGGGMGSYIASNYVFMQFRWVINGMITALVVSHFVKVYKEKGDDRFDVNDVGRSLIKDFFGSMLAIIVMFAIVAAISALIGYIIYGMTETSLGFAGLMIFAGFVGYILLRFPFWYFVFSTFVARQSEAKPVNIFTGIGISGRVFSGNYWKTWVIFFVMWIILALIGMFISLPAQLLGSMLKLMSLNPMQMESDYKLLQAILMSIGEFAKTMVNSVFCISVALHFFSLKEQLDGEGTKKLVDSIGSKQDDDGIELTY